MIPCNLFKGKSLLLGVGSPLRSDDQAGLVLCDLLSQKGVNCVKCEYGLENCVDVIIEEKPEKIIIFDAALFNGGRPGDVIHLEDLDALRSVNLLTTHNIPIKLLLDVVEKFTPLREIHIIGIYPKNLDVGTSISSEVLRTINSLANGIVECFEKTKRYPHGE